MSLINNRSTRSLSASIRRVVGAADQCSSIAWWRAKRRIGKGNYVRHLLSFQSIKGATSPSRYRSHFLVRWPVMISQEQEGAVLRHDEEDKRRPMDVYTFIALMEVIASFAEFEADLISDSSKRIRPCTSQRGQAWSPGFISQTR